MTDIGLYFAVLYFISYRPGGSHAANVTLEIDFGFSLVVEWTMRFVEQGEI